METFGRQSQWRCQGFAKGVMEPEKGRWRFRESPLPVTDMFKPGSWSNDQAGTSCLSSTEVVLQNWSHASMEVELKMCIRGPNRCF